MASAVDLYEVGLKPEEIETRLRDTAAGMQSVTLRPGAQTGGFLTTNWDVNAFTDSKYSSKLPAIAK